MPEYPGGRPEPQRAVTVFAACALLFACVLLAQAGWQLKWLAGAALHKQPGFWSALALAGMAVFALLCLARRRIAASSTATATEPSATPGASPSRTLRDWLGPAEYAGYFLAYVFAVPRLGYLLATLLGVLLLTLRLGYRSRRMLCCAALFSVAVVVLFKSLLQVKIPGGAWYAWLPDAARNFMTLYF